MNPSARLIVNLDSRRGVLPLRSGTAPAGFSPYRRLPPAVRPGRHVLLPLPLGRDVTVGPFGVLWTPNR